MANQSGSILAGKYELLAPIGQGGMASVWRARTLGASGFSRKVAIKRVLQTLTTDPHFVNMFLEEARVVAELQHPNIVQVHDFDQDDEGNYFIVLEWVEGMDLKQYVIAQERTQAPTPWHLVTAIAIEVLRALQAAHSRLDEHGQPSPVFHRDVNPANILLSVSGLVKLADFGLARAADRGSMTDPGIVKGKVSYMSPEMVQGKQASARTDLYAVGIVLWESLTQKKLFYGRSLPETAMMVLKGEVPWLGHERSDLPQELVETVHIALAANPDHRYESALDMLRALCNVLRGHPEPTDSAPLALSVRRAIALLSAI